MTFPGQHDFTDASRNTPPQIHPGVHGHTDNAGSSHDQKGAGRLCCHKPLGHHRARSCIDIHPASKASVVTMGVAAGAASESPEMGDSAKSRPQRLLNAGVEQGEGAARSYDCCGPGTIACARPGAGPPPFRAGGGAAGPLAEVEDKGAGQRERGAQSARVGPPGGRQAAAAARRGPREEPARPAAAAAFVAAAATALCWAVRLRAAAAGAAAAAAAAAIATACKSRTAAAAGRAAGRVAGRVLWGTLGAVGIRTARREGGAAATGEPSLSHKKHTLTPTPHSSTKLRRQAPPLHSPEAGACRPAGPPDSADSDSDSTSSQGGSAAATGGRRCGDGA